MQQHDVISNQSQQASNLGIVSGTKELKSEEKTIMIVDGNCVNLNTLQLMLKMMKFLGQVKCF